MNDTADEKHNDVQHEMADRVDEVDSERNVGPTPPTVETDGKITLKSKLAILVCCPGTVS